MNRNISTGSLKCVVLVGVVVALSSAMGCSPNRPALHPRWSSARTVVDRATCFDRHIRSIWKGEDIAGPACIAFTAHDGLTGYDERRRVRKVCERTQIRTVLTGKAPTSFTLRTCVARAEVDEPSAIRGACRAVARTLGQGLNPVQRAACREHLHDELAATIQVADVSETP